MVRGKMHWDSYKIITSVPGTYLSHNLVYISCQFYPFTITQLKGGLKMREDKTYRDSLKIGLGAPRMVYIRKILAKLDDGCIGNSFAPRMV